MKKNPRIRLDVVSLKRFDPITIRFVENQQSDSKKQKSDCWSSTNEGSQWLGIVKKIGMKKKTKKKSLEIKPERK